MLLISCNLTARCAFFITINVAQKRHSSAQMFMRFHNSAKLESFKGRHFRKYLDLDYKKVFLALLPHIPEQVCRNWLHTHQADSARRLAKNALKNKLPYMQHFALLRYTEDWEARGL